MNDNCVFFWGGVFSNWYPCSFEVNGITYNCAEQYMMAKKAQVFGDTDSYEKIMSSDDPREQKALGRTVKNFNPSIWDAVSVDIVFVGCLYKFAQNPNLTAELLSTQNQKLVEASPYDKIWGIGLDIEQAMETPESLWQGENRLGKVLMQVRDILK